jgi:hypothetical protein
MRAGLLKASFARLAPGGTQVHPRNTQSESCVETISAAKVGDLGGSLRWLLQSALVC